jgi:hypothetical protein
MSTPWQRIIPFKVDVAGIIEIMGTSLYSRATTPVRELIQNAHDAIMRRRQEDLSYKGRIDIAQNADAKTLTFTDDGIGLNETEAEAYLGTLGVGITGLLKKGRGVREAADSQNLIGQFGVGLFSAFMLADRIVVETRKADGSPAVRWEAGASTEIILASSDRQANGTTVTLYLKPRFAQFATDAKMLEEAVKEYADFLLVPIFINSSATRVNLANAAWFDPSPDPETLALELESFFEEAPLEVIPVQATSPVPIAGSLYVTSQRTPGFSGEALVTVTVRRMVISRSIRGLIPPWAMFLRGVVELNDCAPTASREDLVRDEAFNRAKETLESLLFAHFERLARTDPARMASIVNWHRYALAGAAISNQRLRALLADIYPFATSKGNLSFKKIITASKADAIFESAADHVIWFNPERRQERHIDGLFASHAAPCVHTLRSFEESLLAAMLSDFNRGDHHGELRSANPSSPNFAKSILGLGDVKDAPEVWQRFLTADGAKVFLATFDAGQPVMAFINERRELKQAFEDIKKTGAVPNSFQRLIDKHFTDDRPPVNEVLLNRGHPLIRGALENKTSHPLASVLRVLVANALASAGAAPTEASRQHIADDLQWIAEALNVRRP